MLRLCHGFPDGQSHCGTALAFAALATTASGTSIESAAGQKSPPAKARRKETFDGTTEVDALTQTRIP